MEFIYNKSLTPILFVKKEECCGCAACSDTCPMDAILMEPDEEGFDYPIIDEKKCVRCLRCIRVCPFK